MRNTKYKIKSGFITQEIGNKLNIFNGEKSDLIGLNKTAAFVFKKIKQNLRKEDIIKSLAKEYDLKEEEIRNDVESFIQDLLERDIVEEKN